MDLEHKLLRAFIVLMIIAFFTFEDDARNLVLTMIGVCLLGIGAIIISPFYAVFRIVEAVRT